jgi:hypothetical protein
MPAPVSTTPGIGAVRKTLTITLPIASITGLYPIGPTLNNAITIVKVTGVALGAGSSPTCTYKIQKQVPGAAAVDLSATLDKTASYAANGYAWDFPVTTAALQEVAAGTVLGVLATKGSGTEPPVSITVEYFDFDGHSVT